MTERLAGSNKDMNGLKILNVGAPTAGSNDATRQVDLEAGVAAAKARATHTGTQLASTISNFDTAVRASTLNQMAAATAALSLASNKITNLTDPTTAQDAATKNYVDNSVSGALGGVVSGQIFKGAVRAMTPSNVTVDIAVPGATLDGLAAAPGDVFLLANMGVDGGPWVWNGAAVPLTRPTNWNDTTKAAVGSYWVVIEGTSENRFALLTNDVFTLGVNQVDLTLIGLGDSGAPIEVNVGDGSNTNFTVFHNYHTRAVNVVVYRNSSPWDEVDVFISRVDLDNVDISPDAVWGNDEFHVVISKM